MPRKPTTDVIEHRITLGTYERQLISDVAGAYQFKNISTPLITFINDNTSLLLVSALAASYLDTQLELGWKDIVGDLVGVDLSDWLETQNLVGGTIGGIAGLVFGGPLGAAFGFGAGLAAVEAAEAALGIGEDVSQTILEEPVVGAITLIALTTWKTLQEVIE